MKLTRAPTGRAYCKKCHKKIPKGSLKAVVASRYESHDSYISLCTRHALEFYKEALEHDIRLLNEFLPEHSQMSGEEIIGKIDILLVAEKL